MDLRKLQNSINNPEPSQETSSFLEGLFDPDLLKEAQQSTMASNIPLSEVRKNLTRVVDEIFVRDEQLKFQQYMATERKLPAKALHKRKTFFIPDGSYFLEVFKDIYKDAEYGLISERGLPIYIGRYVYPVFGFNGEVIGLIGYDKYNTVKYLLSKTIGFGKSNIFYGMHDMRFIYGKGYVFVVEGIVDQIFLRSINEPAICLNGSSLTSFHIQVLKRMGHNVILVPDNDEAGENAIKYWQKALPDASTLYVAGLEPDLDKWRINNKYEIFQEILNDIKFNISLGMKKEYRLVS